MRKCTDGYLLDSLSSSCSRKRDTESRLFFSCNGVSLAVFSLTALNETLALTTSDALLFGNGTIDVKVRLERAAAALHILR